MEIIAIGVRDEPQIRDGLRALLCHAGRGAALQLQERSWGGTHFFGCAVGEGEGAGDARCRLALALADWIVQQEQPRLLRRLLAGRYAYLRPEERRGVLELLVGAAACAPCDPRDSAVASGGHGIEAEGGAVDPAVLRPQPLAEGAALRQGRSLVAERLKDYLAGHDMVLIDGFITFRVKEYVDALAAVVDRAVDAFLLQREYQEFVALLRYFVEAQPDRPAVAECLLLPQGGFLLQDCLGHPLDGEGTPSGAPSALEAEDLLVGALVSAAPRRIRIHLPEGGPLPLSSSALHSLREVFGGAVDLCRGCSRCRGAVPRPPVP